jgi:c-di-GMP-binding flagellar brake protein YcgR
LYNKRGGNVEKERRKFKRFDAFMTVKYKTQEPSELAGVSLSKDLSREGIKLSGNAKLAKGTLVDLEIDIPDDPKPVHTTGEIVWIQKGEEKEKDFELGIKFLMMDPVDKFRVLDYAYNNWLETRVDDYADPEEVTD